MLHFGLALMEHYITEALLNMPFSHPPLLRAASWVRRVVGGRQDAPLGDLFQCKGCREGSRRFQAHCLALLLARGSSPHCTAGLGVTWQVMSALCTVDGEVEAGCCGQCVCKGVTCLSLPHPSELVGGGVVAAILTRALWPGMSSPIENCFIHNLSHPLVGGRGRLPLYTPGKVPCQRSGGGNSSRQRQSLSHAGPGVSPRSHEGAQSSTWVTAWGG